MTNQTMGKALAAALKRRGVPYVFGIPDVHTVERYRSLAAQGLQHVAPKLPPRRW